MILENDRRRIESAALDDLRDFGIDLLLQPIHPSTVNGQLGKTAVRVFLTTELLKELLDSATNNGKWLGRPAHHSYSRLFEEVPDTTYQRIIIDGAGDLLRLERDARAQFHLLRLLLLLHLLLKCQKKKKYEKEQAEAQQKEAQQ